MRKEIIEKFDDFLLDNDEEFSAIIIGGTALRLIGVITRDTHDVDFLTPSIPDEIKTLSRDFAKLNPQLMLDPDEWINNGPASLVRDLPTGWRENTQLIFNGKALRLHTLGRLDLLRTKLYAFADRDEPDFEDCVNLNPTKEELEECYNWVLNGDASELWPARVDEAFKMLKRRLGIED